MKRERLNADQLGKLAAASGIPEQVLRVINTKRCLKTEDERMLDFANEVGAEDFAYEMEEDEQENKPLIDICEEYNFSDRLTDDERTLLFTTWGTAQALRFILNHSKSSEAYLTALEHEYIECRNKLY